MRFLITYTLSKEYIQYYYTKLLSIRYAEHLFYYSVITNYLLVSDKRTLL